MKTLVIKPNYAETSEYFAALLPFPDSTSANVVLEPLRMAYRGAGLEGLVPTRPGPAG